MTQLCLEGGKELVERRELPGIAGMRSELAARAGIEPVVSGASDPASAAASAGFCGGPGVFIAACWTLPSPGAALRRGGNGASDGTGWSGT